MATEDRSKIDIQQAAPIYDRVIERGIQVLLIFSLAAFGTVQTWSIAVMELMAIVILGAWLLKHIGQGAIEIIRSPLIFLWVALLGLVLLQLVPMPLALLGSISPETVRLLTIAGAAEQGTWHPVSLYPHATKEELYKLLAYCSVFIVVIHHYRTRDQVRRLVSTIILLGCVLVIFAVAQKLTWNGRLYWIYPVSPGIESNLNYIWGPFINRNHFAGYLEMVAPLALGTLLYQRTRHRSKKTASLARSIVSTISSPGLSRSVLLGLAFLFVAAGIFLCVSRGGIIGFSMSMLFFVGMARKRRILRPRISMTLAIVVLVLASVSVFAAWEKIEGRFAELTDSGKIMRYGVWGDTLEISKDFPILGTGAGSFSALFPRYQTAYAMTTFEHAENDYLEALSELGLAGLGVCLALAAAFFYETVKLWRSRKNAFVQSLGLGMIASVVAIAVHSLTDFNLRVPANAMLLSVISGLAISVVSFANQGGWTTLRMLRIDIKPGSAKIYGLFSACIIVMLCAFPGSMLAGEYYFQRAQSTIDDPVTTYLDRKDITEDTLSDYREAIWLLDRARRLAPGMPTYHRNASSLFSVLAIWERTMLQLGMEVPDDFPKNTDEQGERSALNAIQTSPLRAGLHIELANSYSHRGEFDDAARSLERAAALYPLRPSVQLAVANVYVLMGEKELSIRHAQKAAQCDDSYLIRDDHERLFVRQRFPERYRAKLEGSYLFKAYEVVWIASNRDAQRLRRITPQNGAASEVLDLFLIAAGAIQ